MCFHTCIANKQIRSLHLHSFCPLETWRTAPLLIFFKDLDPYSFEQTQASIKSERKRQNCTIFHQLPVNMSMSIGRQGSKTLALHALYSRRQFIIGMKKLDVEHFFWCHYMRALDKGQAKGILMKGLHPTHVDLKTTGSHCNCSCIGKMSFLISQKGGWCKRSCICLQGHIQSLLPSIRHTGWGEGSISTAIIHLNHAASKRSSKHLLQPAIMDDGFAVDRSREIWLHINFCPSGYETLQGQKVCMFSAWLVLYPGKPLTRHRRPVITLRGKFLGLPYLQCTLLDATDPTPSPSVAWSSLPLGHRRHSRGSTKRKEAMVSSTFSADIRSELPP